MYDQHEELEKLFLTAIGVFVLVTFNNPLNVLKNAVPEFWTAFFLTEVSQKKCTSGSFSRTKKITVVVHCGSKKKPHKNVLSAMD